MIRKKHIAAIGIFALLTFVAFLSSGINYGTAQPLVASAVAPASVVVTGCGFNIPAGSIVGAINQTTNTYYAPNANSLIAGVKLNPGSKWYALGQNSTHQYEKILIACALAWVPVYTIGPSPDGPLAGAPLPTGVVSNSITTPN